jgi:predicted DNA-binding transcriptional regulator YafY
LILIAFCRLRNDRRTFKVERIARLTRAEDQQNSKSEMSNSNEIPMTQ